MKEALVETYYCDFNHPDIRKLAADLAKGANGTSAIVKRTFETVRARIPYGFDLYKRKASETLERGHGVCWNKSLLTVALLRCNGIAAHIGSITVRKAFCRPTAGVSVTLSTILIIIASPMQTWAMDGSCWTRFWIRPPMTDAIAR